ncbi:hypothetical protein [Nocardia wallacei]|uniref:hypothetical protein n=1 Tax=Nocardia wallacei TaxID=480035 RepID=UPI0024563404|nr:hypothetical protein [Nocardia wallacei]
MHQTLTLTEQETHQAPRVPFTLAQAHSVMQYHVACRATRCPRKAAALQVLVEAGCVVPDLSKPR